MQQSVSCEKANFPCSSLKEGRKERKGEHASLVWIWPFFRSIFIQCRTVALALPALSQAREADLSVRIPRLSHGGLSHGGLLLDPSHP